MDTRLFWLAVAACVGATEGGLIAGLLPNISEEMNVTIGQAGLARAQLFAGLCVRAAILTVLLGHVGRRRILGCRKPPLRCVRC